MTDTDIIDPEQDNEVLECIVQEDADSAQADSLTATAASLTTPPSSDASSTDDSSLRSCHVSPSESTPRPMPWAGFKYEPVRGLTDRHIAKFLRTQRKNIRRMLQQRGFVDLLMQMEQLRKNPRQGFMAKNKRYQEIMNEYIARVAPQAPASVEAEAVSAGRGVVLSGVNNPGVPVDGDHGVRADDGGSVPTVAAPDASGLVIAE